MKLKVCNKNKYANLCATINKIHIKKSKKSA